MCDSSEKLNELWFFFLRKVKKIYEAQVPVDTLFSQTFTAGNHF